MLHALRRKREISSLLGTSQRPRALVGDMYPPRPSSGDMCPPDARRPYRSAHLLTRLSETSPTESSVRTRGAVATSGFSTYVLVGDMYPPRPFLGTCVPLTDAVGTVPRAASHDCRRHLRRKVASGIHIPDERRAPPTSGRGCGERPHGRSSQHAATAPLSPTNRPRPRRADRRGPGRGSLGVRIGRR